MAGIKILCVGKLKEKYFTDGIAHFSKIIEKKVAFQIIECADEPTPDGASPAMERQIRNIEGERLYHYIKADDYVIALCIDGFQHSSSKFFAGLKKTMSRLAENVNVVFIIGGSLGLSEMIEQRANVKISFSNMTFPHQLMRLILCEQLANYFKI